MCCQPTELILDFFVLDFFVVLPPNRADFGLFCFKNFPIYPPPPHSRSFRRSKSCCPFLPRSETGRNAGDNSRILDRKYVKACGGWGWGSLSLLFHNFFHFTFKIFPLLLPPPPPRLLPWLEVSDELWIRVSLMLTHWVAAASEWTPFAIIQVGGGGTDIIFCDSLVVWYLISTSDLII